MTKMFSFGFKEKSLKKGWWSVEFRWKREKGTEAETDWDTEAMRQSQADNQRQRESFNLHFRGATEAFINARMKTEIEPGFFLEKKKKKEKKKDR